MDANRLKKKKTSTRAHNPRSVHSLTTNKPMGDLGEERFFSIFENYPAGEKAMTGRASERARLCVNVYVYV